MLTVPPAVAFLHLRGRCVPCWLCEPNYGRPLEISHDDGTVADDAGERGLVGGPNLLP